MEQLPVNEILIEMKGEAIGTKAGQLVYEEQILPKLQKGINKVIFPEETQEMQLAFMRGILAYKEDDCLYDFRCANPYVQEKLDKAVKDLSCIHGDMRLPDEKKKKK